MPKKLCEAYIQAWNNQQTETIESLLVDEAVYVDVPSGQTILRKDIPGFLKSSFRIYKDCTASVIEEIWSESGVLTLCWRVTHDRSDQGAIDGVDVIRFNPNGIKEICSYYDAAQERRITDSARRGTAVTSKKSDVCKEEKYQHSGLSLRMQAYIACRIETLMKEQQLYLQAELKIKDLADPLDVSVNHVSQAINASFEINFHQYVNGYRIEYAKQLLVSEPALSVLDVAMQSGFNSNSGFYNVFKRHASESPCDYRKRLLAVASNESA